MEEQDLYLLVGKNIKKHRKQYNEKFGKMTQEMLAEKINTSTSFISRLESEKIVQSISISTLYKLSLALKVSINKLIEGEQNEYK